MTLNLSEDLLLAAEDAAERSGCSLDEWLVSLVEKNTSQFGVGGEGAPPPWLKLAGVLDNSPENREEVAAIKKAVAKEFR